MWHRGWELLQAVATGVVLLTAALAGLAHWVGRPAQRLVRERSQVHDGMDDLREALARITAELHPNHGSSMRDAINRIEATQAAHGAQIAALTGRMDSLQDRPRRRRFFY